MRINVGGIAVRSGVSLNNHKFLPEELKSAVERSQHQNYPLLKDHQATVDNTVGRVRFTQSTLDETGDTTVSFEGFAINEAAQKISDGLITEVSIGAHAEQLVAEDPEDDNSPIIPIGISFSELSLTPTPAVARTSIIPSKKDTEVVTMAEDEKKPQSSVVESSQTNEVGTNQSETQDAVETKMKQNIEELKAEQERVREELERMKLEELKAMLEEKKKKREAASVQEKEEKPESKAVNTSVQENTSDVLEGYTLLEDERTGKQGITAKREYWM